MNIKKSLKEMKWTEVHCLGVILYKFVQKLKKKLCKCTKKWNFIQIKESGQSPSTLFEDMQNS